MLAYCSYQGCMSKNVPFSSLTFFTLPKDHRRQIWIENSGNPQLKNIGPNAVRSFCEKHFQPIDLKRQFNRTILFKTAVPFKYNPNDSDLIPPAIKKDTVLLNKEKNVQSTSQEAETSVVEIDEFDAPDTIEVMQEQDPVEDEFEHVEYVSQQYSDDDQAKKQYNEEEDVMQILYECDTNSLNNKREIVEHTESRTYSRKHRNPSPDRVQEQKRKRFMEELEEIVLDSPEETKCYKSKPTSSSDYVKEQKNGVSTSSSPADYEEDKHFALSLVGYFQRLPMKKKAFAKLKILSYLTELEYEDEAKL